MSKKMREVKEAKDTDASQMCGKEKQPQQRSGNEARAVEGREQVDGDVVDKITTNGRESEGDTEVLNEIEETRKSWKPVDQRSDFRSKSWRDWLERAAEEERTY